MVQKKNIKQPPKKVLQPVKPQQDYHIIFLWIIIGIVSIIRYRLIAVPFERDEGEYGYIGNLFLHGIAPYKDAYSMKLPGTSFMYSIIMFIFGHTNTGVHRGLVLVNAATMYFLFFAFKKIFNPFIGLATATIYGFMAIGLVFDGFAAHATHFICFYTSIALLFLAHFMKSGKVLKIFLCGLMLGMAFLMKQQAVFLILFAALFLFIYLKTEKKQRLPEIIKNLFLLGSGVFVPYSIVFLIIVCTGQFSVFWLWTVKYASTYESVKSMEHIILLFNSSFIPAWDNFYYLWLLALGGILVLFRTNYTRLQKIFVSTYFIASAFVLSAGFYFRQHYFIVLLPVIGLLTGIFIEFIIQQIRHRMKILKSANVALGVLSFIVFFIICDNRKYYFDYTPKMVCSYAYWGNPFIEAQEISNYLVNNTRDSDKIAVLGSEPEIYFYTNRTAATGYLYTYPLVENQPYNEIMQEQMIREIEKNKPAYIVFCSIAYSWLAQTGTPKKIFEWKDSYTRDHYSPIGVADFFPNRGWQVYWNNDMRNHNPDAKSIIIVFKRNSA